MLSVLFKNKTNIANLLAVLTGVAGYLAGNEVVAAHPEVATALVSIVAALNIVSRLFSTIAPPSAPVK